MNDHDGYRTPSKEEQAAFANKNLEEMLEGLRNNPEIDKEIPVELRLPMSVFARILKRCNELDVSVQDVIWDALRRDGLFGT